MAENKPRILLYDLELFPSLAWVYNHYETNVLEYEKHWEICSIAWKWLGEPKLYCLSQKRVPERGLVHRLHELFSESDATIAHNGDKFDKRKSNSKFVQFDINPIRPTVDIDTRKIAKKYFGFSSNSLQELGNFLNLGKKEEIGYKHLWLKCVRNDYKSWVLMEKYNIQDVVLLEKVYLKLRPWIYEQPSLSLSTDPLHCRVCNGVTVVKQGLRVRKSGYFQTYQCKSCHAWFSRRADPRDIPA